MPICALIWLMVTGFANDSELTDSLREWVYQAEVFGQRKESIEGLRSLIQKTPASLRFKVVEAMALVKYTASRADDVDSLLMQFQQPKGFIHYQGLSYLLIGSSWFEVGDWVGPYFFVEVNAKTVLFQSKDGIRREVNLSQPFTFPLEERVCFLDQAPLAEVLTFLARQAQLNSFLPATLNSNISGMYEVSDWLALLDAVCRQSHIAWTRRGSNALFLLEMNVSTKKAPKIKNLESKNESLERFVKSLSDTFDLDLIFDDRLANVIVTVYAEEQPWDETLDCLAMMNGFHWDLVQNGQEKPKLIINAVE